mmetsp:Transcript_127/g.204  ORF Transcript_127/g.204 Transcript_127/m.204 type:complete len:208 (-) Transcript_127:1211-1834(-)
MIGGIWGSIAVGLFAAPTYLDASHVQAGSAGLFYSNGKLLASQLIGIVFVVGWVSVFMLPFFCILHYLGWLRADSLEEIVGLDVSYHGGIHRGDTDHNDSSHHDEERQYYERRELQRSKQRNKVRRRLLMMDLSISGRNAVTASHNNGDGGPRRYSGNSGSAGDEENIAESNGGDSRRRSSGYDSAEDDVSRDNISRRASAVDVYES